MGKLRFAGLICVAREHGSCMMIKFLVLNIHSNYIVVAIVVIVNNSNCDDSSWHSHYESSPCSLSHCSVDKCKAVTGLSQS